MQNTLPGRAKQGTIKVFFLNIHALFLKMYRSCYMYNLKTIYVIFLLKKMSYFMDSFTVQQDEITLQFLNTKATEWVCLSQAVGGKQKQCF